MDGSRQILTFMVSGNRYAMDILHLREVSRMPPVEQEPGAPEGVLGTVRLHGRPVRVYDLCHLMELAPEVPLDADDPLADRQWLVVVRDDAGDRHWRVDTVDDIIDYIPEEVAYEEAPREGAQPAPGVLEVEGHLTYLLSPEFLAGREAVRYAGPEPHKQVEGA